MAKRQYVRQRKRAVVWVVWDELTDEVGHEEEDILGIRLSGGEVHCGFCIHDFDG